jgi:signal transduction histidine kinase
MHFHLLIHNIGYSLSVLAGLATVLALVIKAPKNEANVTMILGMIANTVFAASQLIGVNISDPLLSRAVFMFNLSNLFIALFIFHSISSYVDDMKRQRWVLVFFYCFSGFLFILFLLFPDLLFLPSEPKMYFSNYYVPGTLEWLLRIPYGIVLPTYFIVQVFRAYRKADPYIQNKLMYFGLGLVGGYAIGNLAVPLIYNINVDPMFSAFYGPIYFIPIGYGMLKYNLFDIRVIALRALAFGAIAAVVSLVIFLIGYFNFYLVSVYESFPQWVLPVGAGLVSSSLGFFIWKKFRETEVLKYEFVTIVTHKLRTPLTSIKWSADSLRQSHLSAEAKMYLDNIQKGTGRLVELTDVLANVSTEEEQYLYKMEDFDLFDLMKEIAEEYTPLMKEYTFEAMLKHEPHIVRGDKRKLQFVVQNLLDNAMIYTKKGGEIKLSFSNEKGKAIISVSDQGVGFTKEQEKFLFSRFYRTQQGKNTSPNGMGVALFLCKKIIERHNGTIKAQSVGIDHGSTFTISLPLRD